MSNQNRNPSGTPAGGQFTSTDHAESGVTLQSPSPNMVRDSEHAVLEAEWTEAFSELKADGLESDADNPVADRYRKASDAVNRANRSRDFAIATGQSTADIEPRS